MKNQINID